MSKKGLSLDEKKIKSKPCTLLSMAIRSNQLKRPIHTFIAVLEIFHETVSLLDP